MSQNPLISVIIPVYNGEKFLKDTIESVLDQDYVSFEVIAVDDGSTDRSAPIIKSFEKVQYIYQENQGNASARNRGINEAQGEFISLIDQDDRWVPHKLSTNVKFFEEHPEISFINARHRMFLEPGTEMPTWCKPEWFENDIVDFSPGSLVFRKEVFDQIGKFDTTLPSGNDIDWILRAKDFGLKMGTVQELLLLKRVHSANQSGEVDRIHSALLKVFRRSIKRNKEGKDETK